MDQDLRNKLRNVVTQCRKLLEDSVSQELEGKYGIFAKKDQVTADPNAKMTHLTEEEQAARRDILDHFGHIQARSFKPKDALDQLVREIAFTHLNRFCAYKMMEAREVYVGGQKFREAVSRGINSNGVKFYLADHPEDERLFNTGHQDVAYRHFLDWLGGLLSEEIGVLFNPNDPANRLYPRQKTLDEVLDLLNGGGIKPEETELREAWPKIWSQDETIGWVYQYFTPKELRDQARKESQAPRNSYELAFRNQFFTPRYVVEFLTDNTLGRIWYEMRKGDTKLKDQCRYMVRRPSEVFLDDPLAVAQHLGIPITKAENIPSSVQAAYRGDFANAIAEESGGNRRWIALAVPIDQYEAATGYPFTENDSHPVVNAVWHAIFEPDGKVPLHPLMILVAFSQLVMTASGGPYADRAAQQLWTAFTAAVTAQKEQSELSQDELLKQPVCIPHRSKKDPRELRILDPACGSGHFLLYSFDLLLTIYEESYADPNLGPKLEEEYQSLEDLRRDVPRLILGHNLHGIDIDQRASQIAALALWLRCQRAYQEMGLKKDRPNISRSNFVCAEPMPGEERMLKEFVGQLEPKVLGQVVEVVFEKMKLAAEAGSLLKIEEEIRDTVASAKRQWIQETTHATDRRGQPLLFTRAAMDRLARRPEEPSLFDLTDITDVQFFEQAEAKSIDALRIYAEQAQGGQRLQRRLFADDVVRGFAFIDICHKKFDVVVMNPPFGEASLPSKPYLEDTYADTKGDVYKAFVECFQDRLVPSGMLGVISSRTGFFLGRSADWRNRILLRLYKVQAFADFGQGVLDAVVETAAYVLRSLSESEDRLLTAQLVPEVHRVETDRKGCFSIPKYQKQRVGLKRHQAESELSRLIKVGYIRFVAGAFRKYQATGLVPATTQTNVTTQYFCCVQMTSEQDKCRVLQTAIGALAHGLAHPRLFTTSADLLAQVPGTPFAYWVSQGVRRLFTQFGSFETDTRRACITNPAGDDQRYFRCYWEVPPQALGRFSRWVPIARGGRFSPFYNDVRQVVDWDESDRTYRGFTGTVHRPMKRPASLEHFFKPGLTWPLRGSRFSCQALPEGCIFSVSGKFATSDNEAELPILLGLMNSAVFDFLIGFFAGKVGGVQYEVGLINKVPVPNLTSDVAVRIGVCAIRGFAASRTIDSCSETSHAFISPGLLRVSGRTLTERATAWTEWLVHFRGIAIEQSQEIDSLAYTMYCLSADDQLQIENARVLLGDQDGDPVDETDDDEDIETEDGGKSLDLRAHAASVVSYAAGCVFGRWDNTCSQGAKIDFEECRPFASLPIRPPGGLDVLELSNERPAAQHPVRIAFDGILVDGDEQDTGIAFRSRECMDLLFGENNEQIISEVCQALGVRDVADYFRKPGKGGFWDDHISRYSKSRRKAPIYWLLQSKSKNYAIWLYYHRLDKDLLFKALVNYVEPKIRLETNRREALRSQKAAAGESGKEAKRIAKDAERQEDFLSELRDFEDKLRRAANLHLEPDLNDGVVLNIAPLHELVPWKEAKSYWQELLAGKYEWSSIGKQLREKGIVKC